MSGPQVGWRPAPGRGGQRTGGGGRHLGASGDKSRESSLHQSGAAAASGSQGRGALVAAARRKSPASGDKERRTAMQPQQCVPRDPHAKFRTALRGPERLANRNLGPHRPLRRQGTSLSLRAPRFSSLLLSWQKIQRFKVRYDSLGAGRCSFSQTCSLSCELYPVGCLTYEAVVKTLQKFSQKYHDF